MKIASTLTMLVCLGLWACKPTEFKDSGGAAKKSVPAPLEPAEEVAPKKKASADDSLSVKADNCLTEVFPLNFMIVIDTSISMAPAIQAIKFGVVKAISKLNSIVPQGATESIPEVRVGAVSFIDNASQTTSVAPNVNLNEIRAEIGQLAIDPVADNADGPEAGILGMQRAIDILLDAGSSDMVNVILFISDTYAHGGGSPEARNYDLSNLVKTASSLGHTYIYDSTPTSRPQSFPGDGPPPSDAAVPSEQWQRLRQALQNDKNLGSPLGASLGFPFTESTLLTALPTDLKQSLKLCND